MRNFIEEMKIRSETLGFDLSKVEQGSTEWHISRAGVITASKAYLLLMGNKTLGRWSYIDELVASIATGKIAEEIKAKALQWGKDHEEAARDAYSSNTFETIEEVAFIYKDNSMRAGCSPDGLIAGMSKGLELKCPHSSAVWASFAGRNFIKKEEVAQVQFSMWVTGYEVWGFAKFDPRNTGCKKLHFIEIPRDEEYIKKLEEGYHSLVADMDESLKNLGLEFGSHWGANKDQEI